MRTLLSAVVAMAFMSSCGADAAMSAADTGSSPTHSAVLVELFTSEGCSSCPPADDVLGDLVRNQPIENVTVVGFGEHVDYWDNLGWRDIFSSASFTSRQSNYDKTVFRTGNIYTPQAVVDGHLQMVGSDRAALRRAILDAAKSVKASVRVSAPSTSGSETRTLVEIDVPARLATNHVLDVVSGIVEYNLATDVKRGENGGRVLKHGAVARTLVTAGTINSTERRFSKTVTLPIAANWKTSDLQIVAFVQDRSTGRVVGATIEPLDAAKHGD